MISIISSIAFEALKLEHGLPPTPTQRQLENPPKSMFLEPTVSLVSTSSPNSKQLVCTLTTQIVKYPGPRSSHSSQGLLSFLASALAQRCAGDRRRAAPRNGLTLRSARRRRAKSQRGFLYVNLYKMCMHVYICMYVDMYIYIYMYMYAFVCMYTYILE